MNEEQAREIAIQILDEFEGLLAAKGIKVPPLSRAGPMVVPEKVSLATKSSVFAP